MYHNVRYACLIICRRRVPPCEREVVKLARCSLQCVRHDALVRILKTGTIHGTSAWFTKVRVQVLITIQQSIAYQRRRIGTIRSANHDSREAHGLYCVSLTTYSHKHFDSEVSAQSKAVHSKSSRTWGRSVDVRNEFRE
jgi:hypothetical protein